LEHQFHQADGTQKQCKSICIFLDSRQASMSIKNGLKRDYKYVILIYAVERLGVAQFGSALEWGSRGRRFKSSHPDQKNKVTTGLFSHRGLLMYRHTTIFATNKQDLYTQLTVTSAIDHKYQFVNLFLFSIRFATDKSTHFSFPPFL
jgi:hypothetical protein